MATTLQKWAAVSEERDLGTRVGGWMRNALSLSTRQNSNHVIGIYLPLIRACSFLLTYKPLSPSFIAHQVWLRVPLHADPTKMRPKGYNMSQVTPIRHAMLALPTSNVMLT